MKKKEKKKKNLEGEKLYQSDENIVWGYLEVRKLTCHHHLDRLSPYIIFWITSIFEDAHQGSWHHSISAGQRQQHAWVWEIYTIYSSEGSLGDKFFWENWCLRFNILFDVFGNTVGVFESRESGLWGLGSKLVELETGFKSSAKEIHAANKYKFRK